MNKTLKQLLFALVLYALTNTIAYAQSCNANFNYSQDTSSLCVYFNNSSFSTDSNTTYQWNFGDGKTSNKKNPKHCYSSVGTYSVCLLIIDSLANCSDWYCDSVQVGKDSTVIGGNNNNCQASFVYDDSCYIHFYSTSTGVNNQTYYSWNFGDGSYSSQSDPTHSYASNGQYAVCLTIWDSLKTCVSTYCDSVLITCLTPDTLFDLNGFVMLDSLNIDSTDGDNAKVYLIKYNSVTKTLKAVAKTDADANGAYAFSNVSAGDYLVKAWLKKGSAHYKNYLPTYYVDELYWNKATTVSLTTDMNGIDINLIPGLNPGGPGFVGGKVSKGANKTESEIYIEDVSILVLDMSNQPILAAITDASGEFSLEDLDYGSYQIYTEVEGKLTTPVIVTIDQNNTSIQDIEIVINESSIVASLHELDILDKISSVSDMYPNPSLGQSQVEISTNENILVEVTILDALGKEVMTQSSELHSGTQNLVLNTDKLNKGIYSVKLSTGKETIAYRQLVIVK